MYIDHELLRREEKEGVSDALPRLDERGAKNGLPYTAQRAYFTILNREGKQTMEKNADVECPLVCPQPDQYVNHHQQLRAKDYDH